MQSIPLIPVPAQAFNVQLGLQSVGLRIYQKVAPPFMLSNALYMDVDLNNEPLLRGIICQNGNLIVRDAYFKFSGDLGFYDTTGQHRDPEYTGLGTDYILVWIEPEELA